MYAADRRSRREPGPHGESLKDQSASVGEREWPQSVYVRRVIARFDERNLERTGVQFERERSADRSCSHDDDVVRSAITRA